MFEIGDAVVHPKNGAGIIAGLQTIGKSPGWRDYYKIEIIGRVNTTLMVPTTQAEELGVRHAISAPQLAGVWDVLSARPTSLPSNHKERYRLLEDKLCARETLCVAEVVRDLEWRRLKEEHLNVPGKRIYDKAMHLLAGELAVSQDISVQEAEAQVRHILQDNLLPRYSEGMSVSSS